MANAPMADLGEAMERFVEASDFSFVAAALRDAIEPILDGAVAAGWRRGEETMDEWAERIARNGEGT